jgi:anti-anti-sigma factor
MSFKIDTKEKFTVITPVNENLSDKLTAELIQISTSLLEKNLRNTVVNLKNVSFISKPAAELLVKLEQMIYENNGSFVVCEIQAAVLEQLEAYDAEPQNITPTESEAWDIVQMEEIERELMAGEGFAENNPSEE